MKQSIIARVRTVSSVVAFAVAVASHDLLAASPTDLDASRPGNASVEQPRPFGYAVGDVLSQRVALQLNGRTFTPATLPRAERISAWLERRAPRVESAADGRRWVTVEYQVINAPQALTLIKIPSWALQGEAGTGSLNVGEWPISVAPLTPRTAFAKGGLEELRPDRPAPNIATQPLRRHIALWSSALIATLAIWLGWLLWRNWQAAAGQPFARALRELRTLDERAPEAWQSLHRAFDTTAGRVMQTATLHSLFLRAPQFNPLRSNIEQFFEQSNQRFFGGEVMSHPLSVRNLCRELRRIEKVHES
ncbi:MAG: hypothetical protein ABI612_19890 [Betaproteobacteria bacterium]